MDEQGELLPSGCHYLAHFDERFVNEKEELLTNWASEEAKKEWD